MVLSFGVGGWIGPQPALLSPSLGNNWPRHRAPARLWVFYGFQPERGTAQASGSPTVINLA